MPTAEAVAEVHLELRNQRHRKAYAIFLEEVPGGWQARSEYGAIGAPQKPGKGISGVSYEEAKEKFDALLAEKTGKSCSCCGGVYVSAGGEQTPALIEGAKRKKKTLLVEDEPPAPREEPPPKFFPELLSPIGPEDAGRYIVDDRWELEEKLNGHRIAVWVSGEYMCAFNRLGEKIPVPSRELETELRGKFSMLLDGEFLKGEYVAFDILRKDGVDLAEIPRRTRRRILEVTLAETNVKFIKTYTGTADKEAALGRFQAAKVEGVCFKDGLAGVMPGRKKINVKLKFWRMATVRVATKVKKDGKASFAVEALRAPERACWNEHGHRLCSGVDCLTGEEKPCDGIQSPHCDHCAEDFVWVNVGTVTLSKTAELPAIGTYRECKYLYLGVGDRLYQPEDLGPREDVTDADCLFDKLEKEGVSDE